VPYFFGLFTFWLFMFFLVLRRNRKQIDKRPWHLAQERIWKYFDFLFFFFKIKNEIGKRRLTNLKLTQLQWFNRRKSIGPDQLAEYCWNRDIQIQNPIVLVT